MHIYLFCKVEVAKLGIVIIHGSILRNTTAHPKDIIPRHGLITGAKIRIFYVQMQENGDFFAIFSLLQLRLPTLYNIHLLLHRADNAAIRVACDFLTKDSLVFFVQFHFATSTLKNELLDILVQ